jgi:hypothetical protein
MSKESASKPKPALKFSFRVAIEMNAKSSFVTYREYAQGTTSRSAISPAVAKKRSFGAGRRDGAARTAVEVGEAGAGGRSQMRGPPKRYETPPVISALEYRFVVKP